MRNRSVVVTLEDLQEMVSLLRAAEARAARAEKMLEKWRSKNDRPACAKSITARKTHRAGASTRTG